MGLESSYIRRLLSLPALRVSPHPHDQPTTSTISFNPFPALVLQPSLSHSDYVKLEGECWRSSVDANVLVRSHARPQSELITDLPAPHVRSPVALTYTAHSLAGASVFSPRLKHLYVPLCLLCVPLLTVICSLLF